MNYDTKTNLSLLLDFYGDILTERQKEIAGLSYDEDLSLREISEITGITPQGVRESLIKTEKKLTEMEEKLGLSARFSEMKENIDKMISQLGELKKSHPEIAEEADKLAEEAQKMLI